MRRGGLRLRVQEGKKGGRRRKRMKKENNKAVDDWVGR
jgi:hypothetical protein